MKNGQIQLFPSPAKNYKESNESLSELLDKMEEQLNTMQETINSREQNFQIEATSPVLHVLLGGKTDSNRIFLSNKRYLSLKENKSTKTANDNSDISELLDKATRILQSDTDYSTTLAINIKAYAQAVQLDQPNM